MKCSCVVRLKWFYELMQKYKVSNNLVGHDCMPVKEIKYEKVQNMVEINFL